MPTHRMGSALLLCLALSAFAILIGFAFMRSATRQAMAGREEAMVILAQEAARSGLAHAMEQVLEEYNGAVSAAPIAVGGVSARSLSLSGVSDAEVKVAAPLAPTFLDGPWRRPFTPMSSTGQWDGENSGADDTHQWNHVLLPLVPGADYKWHTTDSVYPSGSGASISNGRGRYIEVEYHNITRPSPATAKPVPLLPGKPGATPLQISFADTTTAYTTVERAAPLCLDSDLRRLTSGTAQQQRQDARYRLRYVVSIEDLNGQILINPLANMDTDWKNPANDYRNWDPAAQAPRRPWLDHAGYVFQNMVNSWQCGSLDLMGRTIANRMAHVFAGRGSTSNADRAWASGPRSNWIGSAHVGLPATFPMMFRTSGETMSMRTDFSATMPIGASFWFGSFAFANSGNYPDNGGYLPYPNMGGRLFAFDATKFPTSHTAFVDCSASFESVARNPHGGEILTPVPYAVSPIRGMTPNVPYTHSLMGPQYSWMNWLFATVGHLVPPASGELGTDGVSIDAMAVGNTLDGSVLIPYTLYGRRLEKVANPAPDRAKWYQGRVDTPWQVNLLTAAPLSISHMLLAYLYPELKNNGAPYITYEWQRRAPGVDILNDQLGAGFTEFPAPSSTVVDPTGTTITVKPDHYQNDIQNDPLISPKPPLLKGVVASQATPAYPVPSPADNRPIYRRYPGYLCRGEAPAFQRGNGNSPRLGCPDDMGQHIDVDTMPGLGQPIGSKPKAHCSHTAAKNGNDPYPNSFVQFERNGEEGWSDADGDGRVDRNEDKDGDGVLDPGEDLDGDGHLDVQEDGNGNGVVDNKSLNHSYFWDLTYAMASAISVAKATWVQYPNYPLRTPGSPQNSPASRFTPATLRNPLDYDTLVEIDALFLRQLGENFDNPGLPATKPPILYNVTVGWAEQCMVIRESPTAVSNTIASLVSKDLIKVDEVWSDLDGDGHVDQKEDANDNGALDPGEDIDGDGHLDVREDWDNDSTADVYTSQMRGAIMERMLNDYRMSFLGSSPSYQTYDRSTYASYAADPNAVEFRPLDFDADGRVQCSGYASSGNPAEQALGLDRHQPAGANGRGPAPVNWFSATGCFYLGKSHFFRVMTRGEVFDTMGNRPVSQQYLESVVCVDPEAPLLPAPDHRTDDIRVLYQRWHSTDFNMELPRQTR